MASKDKLRVFCLESLMILPFRGGIRPCQISGKIPGDDWETAFKLYYTEKFPLMPGRPDALVDVSLCTLVQLRTGLPFIGNQEKAKQWTQNNRLRVIKERILPRLNHFLLHLKYAEPRAVMTGTLRNVGDVDLVFSNVVFEGEVVGSRATPTFLSTLSQTLEKSGKKWKSSSTDEETEFYLPP